MITEKEAFAGQGGASVIAAILKEEPTPVGQSNPRVPPELERIVAKMLAKDPDDRYESMADILVDLRTVQYPPAESSRFHPIRRNPLMRSSPAFGVAPTEPA